MCLDTVVEREPKFGTRKDNQVTVSLLADGKCAQMFSFTKERIDGVWLSQLLKSFPSKSEWVMMILVTKIVCVDY